MVVSNKESEFEKAVRDWQQSSALSLLVAETKKAEAAALEQKRHDDARIRAESAAEPCLLPKV